ncbi:MAG: tRNA-intron lyase [Nitrososphaerales archaeon]
MESQEKAAESFDALLKGEKVVVEDSGRFGELEQVGYGEREGKKLVLKDYEALYLLFTGRLALNDDRGRKVTFNQLAEASQARAGDAWTKFVIYRDLRSRGYIVKDGFGFGTDLRVYERGDFPEKAAKFVVFALDEGTEREVEELSDSVRQIVKMGKEAIVAVIERRGEVIYYKVGRANFRK